jgi:MarR family transcriptional regulator, organic hydroperoxide resistance regulator
MPRRARSIASPDRHAQHVVVGLLRAADTVRRHLANVIEPFGITGQQYNVLRILRGARPEPLATLEIAERMLEHAPGITRLLDRLEAKGLVARERGARDRRQVLCTITREGLALLEELDEPVDAGNRSALAMLSRQELEALARLLDAVHSRKEG